jgi:hypothetical protein
MTECPKESMKTCLILLIGLLPFLTLAQPQPAAAPQALDTNAAVDQQYDIQIENGGLLIAPLKKRIDVKALYEGQGEPYSIAATMGNLVKYLRAANTNLTIVLSPGAEDATIGDLKLHSGDMSTLVAALYVATDGNVRGQLLPGKNAWSIVSASKKTNTSRTFEVFNISGYINSLGKPSEEVIRQRVDEIRELTDQIQHSLVDTPNLTPQVDTPSFRFHPGTSLLIVTGTPDAIGVARKIINALPGQQTHGREDLLDIPPASDQK